MNSKFLNISEISSFINENKWDYVSPFEKLWKKYDSESFTICEQNDKKIITDNIKELHDNLGKQYIEEIQNTSLTHEKMQQHIVTSTDMINNLTIADETKQKLHKDIISVINKSHGTLNETSALTLYEQKNKIILDKSQEYKKIKILDTNQCTWYIGGKVDGLLHKKNEKKIIEVKTRSYCFFKNIRDYENTQIQLYMYLNNALYADLVEYYGSKIKITEIKKNEKTINKIIENIIIFINEFETFLNKPIEYKKEFYSLEPDSKKNFLYNLYLSKMQ